MTQQPAHVGDSKPEQERPQEQLESASDAALTTSEQPMESDEIELPELDAESMLAETVESQGLGVDPASEESSEANPGTARVEAPRQTSETSEDAPKRSDLSIVPAVATATSATLLATAVAAAPTPTTAAASLAGAKGVLPEDIVYTPYALSVGDGFKFGCGMALALFVTGMSLVLLVAIGFLIASMAGISLPLGSVGR